MVALRDDTATARAFLAVLAIPLTAAMMLASAWMMFFSLLLNRDPVMLQRRHRLRLEPLLTGSEG